jgi:hypothetical protein
MNQPINRSPRERRLVRLQRGTASFAATATLFSLALIAYPASARPTPAPPGPSSQSLSQQQLQPRIARMREMKQEADEIRAALNEFCKTVQEAGVVLPAGADPCQDRNKAGLPSLSAPGGGAGGPVLGGGKKGCANAPNKWQEHKGQTSEVKETHSKNCDEFGNCTSFDTYENTDTGSTQMVITTYNDLDHTWALTNVTIDPATGGSITVASGSSDGSSSTTTHMNIDGTSETTTRTDLPEQVITLQSEARSSRQRARHRNGKQPRTAPTPRNPWVRDGRPPVGEDSGGGTSGAEALDNALDMASCQLDKQERYADDILRKYGGSLKDIPDAADFKTCERPDENQSKDEGNSSAVRGVPCPAEGDRHGAAPVDDPRKGDGDGLHQNSGPDVGDIGPLPDVPEVLKRGPCLGPNVDCAASVFGMLPGMWFLQIAGTPVRYAARSLADRLWPW